MSVCFETVLFVSVFSILVRDTETNRNLLFLVSQNKPKHNQNRSCFSLFWFEPKIFFCLFRGHPISGNSLISFLFKWRWCSLAWPESFLQKPVLTTHLSWNRLLGCHLCNVLKHTLTHEENKIQTVTVNLAQCDCLYPYRTFSMDTPPEAVWHEREISNAGR